MGRGSSLRASCLASRDSPMLCCSRNLSQKRDEKHTITHFKTDLDKLWNIFEELRRCHACSERFCLLASWVSLSTRPFGPIGGCVRLLEADLQSCNGSRNQPQASWTWDEVAVHVHGALVDWTQGLDLRPPNCVGSVSEPPLWCFHSVPLLVAGRCFTPWTQTMGYRRARA